MSMRYQFVVILKKDGERATDLLSILLCLFSALSFFFFAYREVRTNTAFILAGTALLLLIGLVINLLNRRRTRVRYLYWLLIAGVAWIGLTSAPWVGGFFFLLAFLEYQTKRPLEIGFDQDRVVINTLIRRRHEWSVFNNIVLKDGLLTLDFKNNRLLQKEVADDDDEDDADEDEFNAYCQDRLMAANRRLA
jgi:hypothetical protein